VYVDMPWWTELRRRVLVEGVSKRQILAETGIHWQTLEKILTHPEPPGYRRAVAREKPKLGPYLERIAAILQSDKAVPRKQRHTAKRIFERLLEEGYTGGYTQVKAAVHELRQRSQEVFLPLVHAPGEAQMDVGFAVVKQGGELRQIPFFVMALPYSDAIFVQAFERACTETFWEFHCRAFEYFGGVPRRITYDNDRVLVAGIMGAHRRKLTHGFLQLQSHYLFDTHFCGVRRANEKGVVEGMVGYARRNFLVPVPQVRELEALNEQLAAACRRDLARRLRGQSARKEVLLAEDQAHFLPLPAAPFDACRKRSTLTTSLSLARFEDNDYSVPVRCAHSQVVVKGYVDRVVICQHEQVIAEHPRHWGHGAVLLEPVHYLALLERKPGGLDHGRPFADWVLPECFAVLRARQEDRFGFDGTREYIQVLRLLEHHTMGALERAVEQALRANALTRDALAQFLIPQPDWRQTTFPLDGREHLRQVQVAATDVASYTELLPAGGPS
jgi:transposase